jgi:hypothetical protein
MGFAVWAMTSRPGSHASLAFAQAEQQSTEPRYDSNGALVRPQNFETWVFVGGSTGLSYEPGMQQKDAGEFHDVYIRPES